MVNSQKQKTESESSAKPQKGQERKSANLRKPDTPQGVQPEVEVVCVLEMKALCLEEKIYIWRNGNNI